MFQHGGDCEAFPTAAEMKSGKPSRAGGWARARAGAAVFVSASDELIKCEAAPAVASDAGSTTATSTLTIAGHCK